MGFWDEFGILRKDKKNGFKRYYYISYKYSMSFLQTSTLNNADPYHLYYDINVVNSFDPTLAGNIAPNLTFQETRTSPIVANPEDWFLSVVRFSLDTGNTLPVWIPQVLLGQADPNKLVYSFTLGVESPVGSGNIYYGKANWQFIPQSLDLPTPEAPLTIQDFRNKYYYVYNYSKITQMMNNCFNDAFTALNAALTAAGQPVISPTTTSFPFMSFDTNSCRWTLNAPLYPTATPALPYVFDTYDLNSSTTGRKINVFMNSSAYVLLSSFPSTYLGNTAAILANGTEYRINVYSNFNQNVVNAVARTLPASELAYGAAVLPVYVYVEQDYCTTAIWNPVKAIVFTTSLLPVQNTLASKPLVFNYYNGQSGPYIKNNENNVLAPIITDLEIPVIRGDDAKPVIYYTPTAEYRLNDLRGTQPVNSIEISVYFRTTYGTLERVQLAPFCMSNLKIMFRRKDFQTAAVN